MMKAARVVLADGGESLKSAAGLIVATLNERVTVV